MTKARDIADSELGSLTVDTDTLVVDETNNRVGIGTSSPSQALDVNGTSNATNLTRGGSQVYSRNNILGTVSQSGGVPTGGVIEKGSNANGQYTKFADGTMICWYQDTVNDQALDGEYVSLYVGTRNWTFPAEFADGLELVAGCLESQYDTGRGWGSRIAGAGTTSASFVFFDLVSRSSGADFHFSFYAVGRWY